MCEGTELGVTGLERPFLRLKLENLPIVRVGVGVDKKGGEIGAIWTTIFNNFLKWKIRKFAYLPQRYIEIRQNFAEKGIINTISTVFNADIDVLLTIGASHVQKK